MSIETLRKKIDYLGGSANDRIRVQKLKSLQAALKNDYNARKIIDENGLISMCIINHSNTKPDYDKRYISIEKQSGLRPGMTFKTLDDNIHWMCYLEDIVETAYFRCEIIRCRYNLKVNDKTYWIYFQGPVETDTSWEQKKAKNFNNPNLSGTIYIKNNEDTVEFFHRFTKFKLEGHMWQVVARDYISVPGILEIEIQEYYDNLAEDLPEIKKEKPYIDYEDGEIMPNIIIGKTEVQQDTIVGYTILEEAYDKDAKWRIMGNPMVEIVETFNDNKICKVNVKKGAIRCFDIWYGDIKQTVEIDITESEIIGDDIVYPYSRHKYHFDSAFGGEFKVSDNKFARILYQNTSDCEIEITSPKKGKFNLYYDEYDTGERFILPITVKSL